MPDAVIGTRWMPTRPEPSVVESGWTKALRLVGDAAGTWGTPAEQFLSVMAGLELPGLLHGSPRRRFTSIVADPPQRQYDNATSRFGAFFTGSMAEAQRYAGKRGQVHRADVTLQKPYEMPAREFFGYFQDITKGADGRPLPGTEWGRRQQELIAEAAARRASLAAEGYDGIVVRNSAGVPVEVASFSDVGVEPLQAAIQRQLGGGGK